MREIKFSAYVIGSKLFGYHGMADSRFAGVDGQEVMIDVRGISFYNGKVDYVTDQEGNEYAFADGSLKAIRQYTGLKDKNGVEIYENDLIRSKHGQKGRVYWSDADLSYLVDWMHEGYTSYLSRCRNGEVVGNIYEEAKE